MALVLTMSAVQSWAALFGGPKFSETKFFNASTNEIWVTEFLYDGKDSHVPTGWFGPNVMKTAIMGEKTVPKTIRVIFKYLDGPAASQFFTNDFSTSNLVLSLKHRHINNPRLDFIFTPERQFTLKYYENSGESWLLKGVFWPDCEDPKFSNYVAVVRAARSMDATRLKQILNAGAPSYWPGCPDAISPLECSALEGDVPSLKLLLDRMPTNYSIYNFANCIKLAAQDGRTNILTILFQNKLSEQVASNSMQEIFYQAAESSRSPAVIEMLLHHFKVGIDFPVRDGGMTMLYVAVDDQDFELASWLLKHGANPDPPLSTKTRILDRAKDSRVRQLLVDHLKK